MNPYYGKYRGKVEANKDPKNLGRIQISVPSVLGEGKASWAYPCVPYAGKNVGMLSLPPIGANIWVEFEGGDPDYPIWVGCFWGEGEMPEIPEEKPGQEICKFWKTERGYVVFNDDDGHITIKVNSSQFIKLEHDKITIDDGEGPNFGTIVLHCQAVTINKDGLEVDV